MIFEDYVHIAAEDFGVNTKITKHQWPSIPFLVQLDKGLTRE